MSTVTSTPEETTDERSLTDRYGRFAGPLVLAGAALLIISAFLSWSYDPGPLGNVRPYGNPAPTQYFAIILGVLGLAFWFGGGPLRKIFTWFDTAKALKPLGYGALAFAVLVILSITLESSGLINVNPGGWLALVGAVLMALGGHVCRNAITLTPCGAGRAAGWRSW